MLNRRRRAAAQLIVVAVIAAGLIFRADLLPVKIEELEPKDADGFPLAPDHRQSAAFPFEDNKNDDPAPTPTGDNKNDDPAPTPTPAPNPTPPMPPPDDPPPDPPPSDPPSDECTHFLCGVQEMCEADPSIPGCDTWLEHNPPSDDPQDDNSDDPPEDPQDHDDSDNYNENVTTQTTNSGTQQPVPKENEYCDGNDWPVGGTCLESEPECNADRTNCTYNSPARGAGADDGGVRLGRDGGHRRVGHRRMGHRRRRRARQLPSRPPRVPVGPGRHADAQHHGHRLHHAALAPREIRPAAAAARRL